MAAIAVKALLVDGSNRTIPVNLGPESDTKGWVLARGMLPSVAIP
jgi:hypothetical protein